MLKARFTYHSNRASAPHEQENRERLLSLYSSLPQISREDSMSLIIIMIAATLTATVEEAITWKMKAAAMARKCPRARQYRFN